MRGSLLSQLTAQVAGLEEAVGVESRARLRAEQELAAVRAEQERRGAAVAAQLEAAQLEARSARKSAADRWRVERECDRLQERLAESEAARGKADSALAGALEEARSAREAAAGWESEASGLRERVAALEAERERLAARDAALEREVHALRRALSAADVPRECSAVRLREQAAAVPLPEPDREELNAIIDEVDQLSRKAAQAQWKALGARVAARSALRRRRAAAPAAARGAAAQAPVQWVDPVSQRPVELALAPDAPGLCLSAGGEAATAVLEVRHRRAARALEFPRAGRACALPAGEAPMQAALSRVRELCALGGAEHDIPDSSCGAGGLVVVGTAGAPGARPEVICYPGLRGRTMCTECGQGPYHTPVLRCGECGCRLYYGTGDSAALWRVSAALWARRGRELIMRRRAAAAVAVHIMRRRRPRSRQSPEEATEDGRSPCAQTQGQSPPQSPQPERSVLAPRVSVSATGEGPLDTPPPLEAPAGHGCFPAPDIARSPATYAEDTPLSNMLGARRFELPASVAKAPEPPPPAPLGRRSSLRGRAPRAAAVRPRAYSDSADGVGRDRSLRPLPGAHPPPGGRWAPVSRQTGRR
eukprot:TRINITY_DN6164_c0_g1_i1.p1 TRINITY_DN6164_c0_g1~~TRINITY_DN6164_c0_g1_i1.p1  ORF type:complete len:624 (+),score=164.80 TRINITY_DN6164_c0_g1_i1:94-1872(+)